MSGNVNGCHGAIVTALINGDITRSQGNIFIKVHADIS